MTPSDFAPFERIGNGQAPSAPSVDFERAAQLGRAGYTLDQAYAMHREGRLSDRALDWYVFLWTWSAARFSGFAGMLQDRYSDRRGFAALERRRARVRALYTEAPHV